jgi:ubiquinone/menaquinone biosynthesis C-methylase UbiE
MNCDRIAPIYRFLEYAAFGGLLQQCRTAFLPQSDGCSRALVVGDGDGRFLQELCRTHKALHADSLDSSGAMLNLQRARLSAADRGRIRFHRDDARRRLPGHAYDLIVTHFFFDCLTQAETSAMIEEIAKAATPNAIWLVSEFRVPHGFWGKLWARFWIGAMYAFFRIATGLRVRAIPNYGKVLQNHGFSLLVSRTFSAGLITAEAWQRSP